MSDDSGEQRRRADAVLACLEQSPLEHAALQRLAREEGGFQQRGVRQRAWPKLLNIDRYQLEDIRLVGLRDNKHSDQVQRDVARSLWHFDSVRNWKGKHRRRRREKLSLLINAVLNRHGFLNYYQGYHDVATVFLVVGGDEELAYAMLERMTLYFLRDFMSDSFAELMALMGLLFPLVATVDAALVRRLRDLELQPYYAVSWVLTWFSHDLRSLPLAERLFDCFLCHHPLLPLYVAAAVTLQKRKGLAKLDTWDFGSVHRYMGSIGADVDMESALSHGVRLLRDVPPDALLQRVDAEAAQALAQFELSCLSYPPPWWGDMTPDWLLLEQRRQREGRKKRSRAVRHRRRVARLAGANMGGAAPSGLAQARWGIGLLGSIGMTGVAIALGVREAALPEGLLATIATGVRGQMPVVAGLVMVTMGGILRSVLVDRTLPPAGRL